MAAAYSRFQSTPARGGRRGLPTRCCGPAFRFNPRPRAAGDGSEQESTGTQEVSIHARARRATGRQSQSLAIHWFQSTPARGGRPWYLAQQGSVIYVSIHARARRATPLGNVTRPVHGSFNPRPRAAGDACSGTAHPATTWKAHSAILLWPSVVTLHSYSSVVT